MAGEVGLGVQSSREGGADGQGSLGGGCGLCVASSPFAGRRRGAGWEAGAFVAPRYAVPHPCNPQSLGAPTQHPRPLPGSHGHPKRRGPRQDGSPSNQSRWHLLEDVFNRQVGFWGSQLPLWSNRGSLWPAFQASGWWPWFFGVENLLGRGCKGRAVLPSVQGQVLSLCQAFDRI